MIILRLPLCWISRDLAVTRIFYWIPLASVRQNFTLADIGESRFEDRKSVFLGYAKPVSTECEAIAWISEIKSRYPDARHHVYAYSLRENYCTRYSDDHEPQGSAGLPVLDILRRGEIVDACIVVVRYFGGILLGAQNLYRAYASTALELIEKSEVKELKKYFIYQLKTDYSTFNQLLTFANKYQEFLILESKFEEEVNFLIAVKSKNDNEIIKSLIEKQNAEGEERWL